MIVAMAGLPGTGKTTLANTIGSILHAAMLNKDQIRHSLFGPSWTTYQPDQDDFVMRVMLQTTEWLVERQSSVAVILDGRTFSREYQRKAVRDVAAKLKRPLRWIECVCSDATATRRIREDRGHPAANRLEMYWRLKASFEPFPHPVVRVDTEQPIEACVAICRAAIEATSERNL